MDSGLVIVSFITVVYILIMFTLLFYVKYEWCDLLFKNNTVSRETIVDWNRKIGSKTLLFSYLWAGAIRDLSMSCSLYALSRKVLDRAPLDVSLTKRKTFFHLPNIKLLNEENNFSN